MDSFPQDEVLAACATYGPKLNVPDGLDAVKVMIAVASNESSLGANCGPRHEPAYDVGGSLAGGAQAGLLAEYGRAAACSYGPWQMMFANFQSRDVSGLSTDLDLLSQEFVRFFNAYVIAGRKATTLEQIGQVWNGGHVMTNPGSGVVAYCRELQAAYDAAMGAS
jgi:hypothetical protein